MIRRVSIVCRMDIYSAFPILANRFTDIGKSFTNIGNTIFHRLFDLAISVKSQWFTDISKSPYFPISEIRIHRLSNLILICWYWKIIRYRKFELPVSVDHFDFAISVNQSIYRYRKFEFPISVNVILAWISYCMCTCHSQAALECSSWLFAENAWRAYLIRNSNYRYR